MGVPPRSSSRTCPLKAGAIRDPDDVNELKIGGLLSRGFSEVSTYKNLSSLIILSLGWLFLIWSIALVIKIRRNNLNSALYVLRGNNQQAENLDNAKDKDTDRLIKVLIIGISLIMLSGATEIFTKYSGGEGIMSGKKERGYHQKNLAFSAARQDNIAFGSANQNRVNPAVTPTTTGTSGAQRQEVAKPQSAPSPKNKKD